MPDVDEILTIREVASLLKIGEKTAYMMAQSGELPAFKVRGQWRIRRTDIQAWIDAHLGDRGRRTGAERDERGRSEEPQVPLPRRRGRNRR